MAVTLHASGTIDTTGQIDVELTVVSIAIAGVFTVHIDFAALAAGDVVESRIKRKILAGGTARELIEPEVLYGAQALKPIWDSDVLGNDLSEADAVVVTIKQTFGAGRLLPYKVLRY